jgi:hypothetical protein
VIARPSSNRWQKSGRSLLIGLGFALFILVGFLGILAGYWLPMSTRVPHALEILTDEFVYAGALVVLLMHDASTAARAPRRWAGGYRGKERQGFSR